MKTPKPIKMSSGNYYVRMRLNGESISVVAPTAKEATRKAEQIKAEQRNGKRIADTDKTLGMLIDSYIEKYEPTLSPSTIRGYTGVRKHRFQSYMNKRPKDIDFQAMINAEIKAGLSVKTVKNGWGAVTAALTDVGTPIPKVKFPLDEKADDDDTDLNFLEPEEIPLFLKAAEGDLCEVELLLELHSLRLSEVLKVVKNKQYDLKTNEIIVHGAIVRGTESYVEKKANKSRAGRRRIPIMIPRLAELLKGNPEVHSSSAILSHCHKVCKEAGVRDVTNHGLRHTFASLAYSLNFSEELIMLWGGWDDPGTMHKIYIHLTQREKTKSGNAMRDFYTPKTKKDIARQAEAELKEWLRKYSDVKELLKCYKAVEETFSR